MRVITVPSSFDHRSVDRFLDEAATHDESRVLVDAHRVRWIDPSGMLALLVAGRSEARRGGRPVLKPPQSPDVLSYLGRMNFFPEASTTFEVAGRVPNRRSSYRQSDALLEVTAIDSHDHVRRVVSRIQSRAGDILSGRLGLPATSVIQFAIVLSEVCQNVVEHAGNDAKGWVAVQAYNWARRLGRYAAVISVMDCGVGFRGSLDRRHGDAYGAGWSDATALEAALLRGLSRFPETGRGQGLRQVRRQVQRWGGALYVRSGRARISFGPRWNDSPPLVAGLAPFPGAQLVIVIPAAKAAGSGQ